MTKITLVHFTIHDYAGERGVAKNAKLEWKVFSQLSKISESRLRNMQFPEYLPEFGISVFGYEHTAEEAAND